MARIDKVYSVDVKVYATAYIRAPNKKAAEVIAAKLRRGILSVTEHESIGDHDVPISGLRFDDPRLPELSLSPAMTLAGLSGVLAEVRK